MTQAEWGSDQTSGALLSVWAGRPLHREPQTNQDSAALPPGRRADKGWPGQKRGQARLHKGSQRKLNCAGGWGECWGGVGGALEESASQGPHSGQAWLGPLLALAATHKKAGPSLLIQ